jgi:hypothetical protein
MGVIYAAALRTTRMTAVVTAIDVGTAGKLKIGTTAMGTVLATLTLADPCGTVSGDVLTFDFDPDISDTSADNSGTAAAATITDSSDNVIVSGLTVGLSGSGANIILDNTSIVAGQTVTITAGTLTHNTAG